MTAVAGMFQHPRARSSAASRTGSQPSLGMTLDDSQEVIIASRRDGRASRACRHASCPACARRHAQVPLTARSPVPGAISGRASRNAPRTAHTPRPRPHLRTAHGTRLPHRAQRSAAIRASHCSVSASQSMTRPSSGRCRGRVLALAPIRSRGRRVASRSRTACTTGSAEGALGLRSPGPLTLVLFVWAAGLHQGQEYPVDDLGQRAVSDSCLVHDQVVAQQVNR
jgi:hypothetical protein